MPFTIYFDSNSNTEVFDASILEGLYNRSGEDKFYKIAFDTYFNQNVHKLPLFIKHVEFGLYFNHDIRHIGDHIESIIFNVSSFNYNLATFPKGLKELKIACDKIYSNIENINPNLCKLTIKNDSFDGKLNLVDTNITQLKIISNKFNQSLSSLPKGLKKLDIMSNSFNSPIDDLPIDLEYLKISSTAFNKSVDNVPRGLKTFILEDVNLFNHPINNLPHGLETFNLHDDNGIYKHTLENLPSSITKLVLANYWGNLNSIPDSVVELEIWFPPNKSREVREYIQHWNKIPSSLKILDINKELAKMNNVHNMIDIIKDNINCKGICINGIME
jgi:hypothetical protein